MKKCLRKKCQKDFEPNKPKQVFCSDKCRVYNSRELKAAKLLTGSNEDDLAPISPDLKKAFNESPLFSNVKKIEGEPKGKASPPMPDPKKDRAGYAKWLRENS